MLFPSFEPRTTSSQEGRATWPEKVAAADRSFGHFDLTSPRTSCVELEFFTNGYILHFV